MKECDPHFPRIYPRENVLTLNSIVINFLFNTSYIYLYIQYITVTNGKLCTLEQLKCPGFEVVYIVCKIQRNKDIVSALQYLF